MDVCTTSSIVHVCLINNLKPYGYNPDPITTRLWKYKHRNTTLILVVENSGINKTGR